MAYIYIDETDYCIVKYNNLLPILNVSFRSIAFLDLTEDIKKRWQKYTEGLYKKDLHNPDNHDDHSPRARHPGM